MTDATLNEEIARLEIEIDGVRDALDEAIKRNEALEEENKLLKEEWPQLRAETMRDDLVKRLRASKAQGNAFLLADAAAEIERLRMLHATDLCELQRHLDTTRETARAALAEIIEIVQRRVTDPPSPGTRNNNVAWIASRALKSMEPAP